MNPLVSIIIPCYNAERWLRAAIESALGQSYSNIQVIVVDDGSTDESRHIIEQSYPEVMCISKPNRGPSAARNEGLRVAQGDWIQFLDADDLLHPDKVRLSLEVSNRNPALAFVWAPHLSVSEDFSLAGLQGPTISEISISRNALEATYAPSTSIFRASFLERIGGWDESLKRWVDLEYHARVAAQLPRHARFSESLYFYRQHCGSKRISNSKLNRVYIEQALPALNLATRALENSTIPPRVWKTYLWPFYVHLARASALQGDKKAFQKLLSKAAHLRGNLKFQMKCAMATTTAAVVGVKRTEEMINVILNFGSAGSTKRAEGALT